MSVLDVISTPLREVRRLLALHALLDRLFQSTPLREGRQQMFPDFLKEFRNTSTNFVVLDEICGCEVPSLKTKGTKMWCEGSGDFMTAWGSHVRLCGGDTAYMILLFLLLRFAIFSKISPFSPHQRGICVSLLFGIGHVLRWQCAHHYGMPSSRLVSRMDLKVLRTMGAWIEIRNFNIEITMTRIAPRKGAWIEIMSEPPPNACRSFLLRKLGLKPRGAGYTCVTVRPSLRYRGDGRA